MNAPALGFSPSPTLKLSISGLRGVYPDDISPDKWVDYVRAFAAVVPEGAVAIARDARATSPALLQIAAGVLSLLGRTVHNLGLVPTPTIKAYVRQKKLAGGLMVSASHNPEQYNALKFTKRGGLFFHEQDNARFLAALQKKQGWKTHRRPGAVLEANQEAIANHLAAILRVVPKPRRQLKVVIDPVGSCATTIAQRLLQEMGVQVHAIHAEETPRFPRPPEPVAAALAKLCRAVRRYHADAGFAFDPDADRLSLVDERGQALGEEYTLPLAILAVQPRGTVVTNLSTSMLCEVAAARCRCQLLRTPVGEAHVVCEMQRRRAMLGGEGNGGVIDSRVPSFGRDALVGMAHIVHLLGSSEKTLSQHAAELPQFAMIKKTFHGVSPDRMEQAIAQLCQQFPDVQHDRRDGYYLRAMSADNPWWLHLRVSNTEPVVRAIAEAKDQQFAKKLIDSLRL
ncbi:MAG: phosphoglucosamine mutase [Turneriella sp.]|nr:phosphoglucosamine mutase [Turneriella sp.]